MRRIVPPPIQLAGLVLVGLALSGCQTNSPRCQLAVSNVTEQPISNIVLTLGDVALHTTPSLEPHSEEYYKPTRALPSKDATIEWQKADGKTLAKRAPLEEKLGPKFRGRVFFQIDKNDNVQVFVVEDTNANQPVMPWGKPERWEGMVGIPGMSGEEDR